MCISPKTFTNYIHTLANNISLSHSNSTDLIILQNTSNTTTGPLYIQYSSNSSEYDKDHRTNLKLTSDMFEKLCPAILMQIETENCRHDHHGSRVTKMVENGNF